MIFDLGAILREQEKIDQCRRLVLRVALAAALVTGYLVKGRAGLSGPTTGIAGQMGEWSRTISMGMVVREGWERGAMAQWMGGSVETGESKEKGQIVGDLKLQAWRAAVVRKLL